MLVISRKKNESIVINNDITISVVEMRGDKVRLAIVSPRDVPVHRQEVFAAIHGISPDQPTFVPQPPTERRQSFQQIDMVEITVDQLVDECGATDADVDRKARFTTEGSRPQ